MNRSILIAVAFLSTTALAKLPAPVLDDAAKAKAAETAAKAAWQAKVDAYQLCKAQDRVVAGYRKGGSAAVNTRDVKQTAAAPAAPAAAPPAAAASGTPVAQVTATPAIPPCTEPGPFASAPPAQKPLETSGAHSPAATATSPPSVRPESAQMAPAKPATAQSKKP